MFNLTYVRYIILIPTRRFDSQTQILGEHPVYHASYDSLQVKNDDSTLHKTYLSSHLPPPIKS